MLAGLAHCSQGCLCSLESITGGFSLASKPSLEWHSTGTLHLARCSKGHSHETPFKAQCKLPEVPGGGTPPLSSWGSFGKSPRASVSTPWLRPLSTTFGVFGFVQWPSFSLFPCPSLVLPNPEHQGHSTCGCSHLWKDGHLGRLPYGSVFLSWGK